MNSKEIKEVLEKFEEQPLGLKGQVILNCMYETYGKFKPITDETAIELTNDTTKELLNYLLMGRKIVDAPDAVADKTAYKFLKFHNDITVKVLKKVKKDNNFRKN